MPNPSVDLKNRYLALLLAWMVPGAGHVYQGRTGKGLLYGGCIISLFMIGLAMGDWRIVYWRWVSPLANTETFCFNYLCQFWSGLMALPALIQSTLRWYDKPFILWGFMTEPEPKVINGLYLGLGKFVEIGTLYTSVAGLLNILAMYDAFDGPAHTDQSATLSPSSPEPKGDAATAGASA